MSTTMDILAKDVAAYHFCQMDNEPTCSIPEFVHSVAAQISQSPSLAAFRQKVVSDGNLQTLLSLQSCMRDPSRAFVQGVLEPLQMLRCQGKLPNQKCILLIDGLCEAECHRTDSGDTITTFLAAHLGRFPKWLRIICTVRSNMMDIVRAFPFHRLRYVLGDSCLFMYDHSKGMACSPVCMLSHCSILIFICI